MTSRMMSSACECCISTLLIFIVIILLHTFWKKNTSIKVIVKIALKRLLTSIFKDERLISSLNYLTYDKYHSAF